MAITSHDFNTIWNGERVCLDDRQGLTLLGLAGALSRIPRWNGQSMLGARWTVLHHTIVVWQVLLQGGKATPEALLYALFHDSEEIATSDIPNPWKTDEQRDTGRTIRQWIYQYTVKAPYPGAAVRTIVKSADEAALTAEGHALMHVSTHDVLGDVDPVVERAVREIANISPEQLVPLWIGAVKAAFEDPAIKSLRARV